MKTTIVFATLTLATLAGCGQKQEESASTPVAAAPAASPSGSKQQPAGAGAPRESPWVFSRTKDELTDEKRVVARMEGGESHRPTQIAVRCIAGDLDIVVGFADYLGNESRPVKYRFDQEAVKSEDWSISSQGTALYVLSDWDFARRLIKAKKVIVEADDFRGVAHRVSLDYEDTQNIAEVLAECKVPVVSLDEKIPGLRPEVALQMERWGPKNISTKKQALAQIAGFKGPIDSEMTPEFALAAQAFSDGYVERCRARKINGENCKTMRIFWDAKIKQSGPWVSSIIYEQAPKSLKAEMGNLKNSD